MIRPRLTATIGGVITNRVEVQAVKPEPRARTKGRWRADRTVSDVRIKCVTAPEETWQEIDEAAQRLQINRSDFLRRAARLLLEQLAQAADRTARGCGAGTASCTSRSAPRTTAPGSRR